MINILYQQGHCFDDQPSEQRSGIGTMPFISRKAVTSSIRILLNYGAHTVNTDGRWLWHETIIYSLIISDTGVLLTRAIEYRNLPPISPIAIGHWTTCEMCTRSAVRICVTPYKCGTCIILAWWLSETNTGHFVIFVKHATRVENYSK